MITPGWAAVSHGVLLTYRWLDVFNWVGSIDSHHFMLNIFIRHQFSPVCVVWLPQLANPPCQPVYIEDVKCSMVFIASSSSAAPLSPSLIPLPSSPSSSMSSSPPLLSHPFFTFPPSWSPSQPLFLLLLHLVPLCCSSASTYHWKCRKEDKSWDPLFCRCPVECWCTLYAPIGPSTTVHHILVGQWVVFRRPQTHILL